MVHDLKFESHPGKPLEEHIRGVQKGTLLRSSLPIAEIAAIFHDLGKINPNFQSKLHGENNGYSNHSLLSVISFVNFSIKNKQMLMNKYDLKSQNDLLLFILKVSIIIGKHHKNLPNLTNGFIGSKDLEKASLFVTENKYQLPISDFIMKELITKSLYFELNWNKKLESFITFLNKFHIPVWKQNPLSHFLDTQEAFAALIESDKRDAGNNNDYYFRSLIEESIFQLNESLEQKFIDFENSSEKTYLNIIRTQIRLEAVSSIKNRLSKGERLFTLTAPTGAGKTFTMLAIANEIRKNKGKLGIIYSLPFLSITEQVQKISEELLDEVLSINSKTENERIKKAQLSYESDQSEENLKEILKEDFIQNTFDHPFIITTFVQFFETLVSNKNSTLLKLPNYQNRIFLIDEVQALPPRLYIFFSAWLDEFCKRNNSFAILSTATMPNLEIPIKNTDESKRADLLFKNYSTPNELLDCEKYFSEPIFNRYKIDVFQEKQSIESLANHIIEQDNSCLIILNTIADTKKLYYELKEKADKVLLLNTYFIPDDRTRIIEESKNILKANQKVILISTQLIEAGVDIDFPTVYRDLCPLPSLIQSAGRCNRNNKSKMGEVYLFELVNEKGQSRANLIYRDEGKKFLEFCKENINEKIEENQLFDVQSKFFTHIQKNLTIGEFKTNFNETSINMVQCVNNAEFEELGKFKLINNDIGKQEQYYILKSENDDVYEKLNEMIEKLKSQTNYKDSKKIKIEISNYVKQLSGRILSVRKNKSNENFLPPYRDDILGIKFISPKNYSPIEGLLINNIENCFL